MIGIEGELLDRASPTLPASQEGIIPVEALGTVEVPVMEAPKEGGNSPVVGISIRAEAEGLTPPEERLVGEILEEADSKVGEPEFRTFEPEEPLETTMVGKREEEDDPYI